MHLATSPASRPSCRRAAALALVVVGCGHGATEPAGGADFALLVVGGPGGSGLDQDLHLVRSDGAAVRRLTTLPNSYKYSARWSPDGQQIAFVRAPYDPTGSLDRGDVWGVGADGTGLQQLTTTNDVEYVRWIGAGRLAVLRRMGPAARDWFAVPAAGGAPAALAVPEAVRQVSFGGGVEWSPDGSRVAYPGAVRTDSGVVVGRYVSAADGSGARFLTGIRTAQWAPGGTHLAVTSPRARAYGGVVALVRVADGARTTVLEDSTVAGAAPPAAAPDLGRVAYTGPVPGTVRAYIATRGGGARLAYAAMPVGSAWGELEVAWRPTAP